MLSTKDGSKAVYETDLGRDAKVLRRSIVKTCISNAKMHVFNMFSKSAATGLESTVPKWLNVLSVCELLDAQIEVGCLRHGRKSEMVTTRPMFKIISKGHLCPTKEELGQFIAHRIYGSVMGTLVFGQDNARKVMFENVVYLSYECNGNFREEII